MLERGGEAVEVLVQRLQIGASGEIDQPQHPLDGLLHGRRDLSRVELLRVRSLAAGQVADARTDTNTIEYVLGGGTDASFSCDGYGGTALGDRAYLTRSDRPEVYVVAEL